MKLIIGIILFGFCVFALWHTVATNEMMRMEREQNDYNCNTQ